MEYPEAGNFFRGSWTVVLLSTVLVLFSGSRATGKDRIKIPELDLRVPGKIKLVTVAPLQPLEQSSRHPDQTACVLQRVLSRDLSELNRVTVVGREELFSTLIDYGWQNLDFTEPEPITKLARVTGVDFLFTGKYEKSGKELNLELNVWQRTGDKLRRVTAQKFHGKRSNFTQLRQRILFNLLPRLEIEITERFLEYFAELKPGSYGGLKRQCAQEAWRLQPEQTEDGSDSRKQTSPDSGKPPGRTPTKKLKETAPRQDMQVFAAYRAGIEAFGEENFKQARRGFLKVFRAEPENRNNLLWLACVEIKLGYWERARDRVQKVLAGQPNHRLAGAYLNHINKQLPVNR